MGVFQGMSLRAAIILQWLLGFSVSFFHPGTLHERAAWSFWSVSFLWGCLKGGREPGFSLPFTLDLLYQVLVCLNHSATPSSCACIAYLETVKSKRDATMSLGLVDHHLQIHTVSSLRLLHNIHATGATDVSALPGFPRPGVSTGSEAGSPEIPWRCFMQPLLLYTGKWGRELSLQSELAAPGLKQMLVLWPTFL